MPGCGRQPLAGWSGAAARFAAIDLESGGQTPKSCLTTGEANANAYPSPKRSGCRRRGRRGCKAGLAEGIAVWCGGGVAEAWKLVPG